MKPFINTIQNVSNWGADKPTIKITCIDDNWEVAYKNWIDGKNPTDSPLWKKAVIAFYDPELNI